LSARAWEVPGLVAEGLTNKRIAARLHRSVIGRENRTQLAAWSHERISVANPQSH
jgi:FixJ family two-component response regulator